jgi:hypothetical protein
MNDLEERRKRAHEMAGDAIDGLSDVSANLEDQASRKRSLLEGPDEFQSFVWIELGRNRGNGRAGRLLGNARILWHDSCTNQSINIPTFFLDMTNRIDSKRA